MNLYSSLFSRCLSHPERIFLYEASPEGIRAFTYGEVLKKVEGVARYLNSLRLPQGSRIAILSENRHEWAVAYFAVVSLGFVAVPLDAQATLKEWAPILKHAEARALFVSERLQGCLETASDSLNGLEKIFFGEEFEKIAQGGDLADEWVKPPVGESDLATLVYTSGTTGTPKGVLLSHGNLLNSAREMNTGYADEGGVCATILPFNHKCFYG